MTFLANNLKKSFLNNFEYSDRIINFKMKKIKISNGITKII